MAPNQCRWPEHGNGELSLSRMRTVTRRVVPFGTPRCPQARYSAGALAMCRLCARAAFASAAVSS